ncbi:hypothetical protein AKJ38_02280 [candidate division MSBL1 archaeon SCGC-AAA259I14]|uniref:Uncharacterized protein n=1 Tax=candidate division MSBL1 archaeon SCGC-AAA259I14 TaxID=1698268 RepID=A0A133URS0_9EURY|nr:hypothetical protein AKJ38_02280 [candidate division MSBL1 archaeon SCGC-AAA259I14]
MSEFCARCGKMIHSGDWTTGRERYCLDCQEFLAWWNRQVIGAESMPSRLAGFARSSSEKLWEI